MLEVKIVPKFSLRGLIEQFLQRQTICSTRLQLSVCLISLYLFPHSLLPSSFSVGKDVSSYIVIKLTSFAILIHRVHLTC